MRRGRNCKLDLPSFNTEARQGSFSILHILTWNVFPAEAANAPDLKSFKGMLVACLVNFMILFNWTKGCPINRYHIVFAFKTDCIAF